MYNVYRRDRPQDGNGANSNHGGVLIAISKEFISSEIKELQTDYEIVWAEINIAGTKKIIIGFYYRPPSDDGKSLDNLDESLNRLKKYHASNIWHGGDFNLGHIDWSVPSFVSGKPEPKLHNQLLDIIDDHNLHQTVDKPTRKDRTLDLFLVTNPSSVNKITTLPPIEKADHDIVYIELDTRLKRVREVPRKIMKFNKANWENIKSDLQKVLEKIQLKNNDTRNTVDTLWNIFKSELITSIESNVPHKIITYRHRLPWVTPNLRKLINKKNKAERQKDPENFKNLRMLYKANCVQHTGTI